MSRALDYKKLDLSWVRDTLRLIRVARASEQYKWADDLRKTLLTLDEGMRITQNAEKITLWHWPKPPFTGELHYANYGEFVANSEPEEIS